jgi:hypothetical protein
MVIYMKTLLLLQGFSLTLLVVIIQHYETVLKELKKDLAS